MPRVITGEMVRQILPGWLRRSWMLFASELARPLISMFDGISEIDCAHVEELLSVPGMGIAKTAQLKAAIEIGKGVRKQIAQSKNFNNAAAVADYIRQDLKGNDRNAFWPFFWTVRTGCLLKRTLPMVSQPIQRSMCAGLWRKPCEFPQAHLLWLITFLPGIRTPLLLTTGRHRGTNLNAV